MRAPYTVNSFSVRASTALWNGIHGNPMTDARVRVLVKADLYFTTPSVVIQPMSALALMAMTGHPMRFAPMNWLGLSLH